jgi:uncharacterized delta-60 repeat protein
VAVIRFTPDGELDTTFGTGGIARIDLGVGKVIDEETFITDNAWGLTAREGGYAVNATTPNQSPDRTDVDFAIVGLTASGQIDPGFGTNGVVIADLNASADSARNIGVQADGKIVATGYSRDTADVVSPVLIRLTNAGVLDAEFGTNGLANHVVLEGVTEAYQWASQGENYRRRRGSCRLRPPARPVQRTVDPSCEARAPLCPTNGTSRSSPVRRCLLPSRMPAAIRLRRARRA